MGRMRKRHNWKARQQVQSTEDTSSEPKQHVQVELEGAEQLKGLMLPSKKSKRKKISNGVSTKKTLSRKQKKVLQKILEQKEKKSQRADMLSKLSDVQASEKELSLLYTTSKLGTGDRLYSIKRTIEDTNNPGLGRISSISGINKKRRRKSEAEEASDESDSVVSSDSSGEEDEDDAVEKEQGEDVDNDTSAVQALETNTSHNIQTESKQVNIKEPAAQKSSAEKKQKQCL